MMCRKCDEESVLIAADYIRRGKVVILPTDTVYGFSGIVDGRHYSFHTNQKIAEIKGRDDSKQLIHLIAKPEDVKKYTRVLIPDELLCHWPGPLTIVVHTLQKAGFFETTAFRCPDDPWLRSVIARCGAPVYSTSVNISGEPCMNNVSEIKAAFGTKVDLIVDDGDKSGGVPSTIVKIEKDGSINVLRQGQIQIAL